VQQALNTELVEPGAVLRQLAVLEVVDQADCGEHQRIAGEVVDVWMAFKPFYNPRPLRSTLTSSLLIRLVAGQPNRGRPVTGVAFNLLLVEVEQITLLKACLA